MTRIWIDEVAFDVPEQLSVAAAMQHAGCEITRWSVSGEPRAPFCGMGVCQECRVSIDRVRRLACQATVQDGMCIHRVHNETDEP